LDNYYHLQVLKGIYLRIQKKIIGFLNKMEDNNKIVGYLICDFEGNVIKVKEKS